MKHCNATLARYIHRASLLCVCVWVASLACLSARAQARSVLYPELPPVLHFSHRQHGKTACQRCHAGVEQSTSANDRLLPAEAVCRACHRETTRSNDAAPLGRVERPERCRTCHVDYSGAGSPAKLAVATPRIRFAHRLHARQGIGCTSCHRFDGDSEEAELPTMVSCMECHQIRRVTNRCSACHLTEKDGRLRTRFGDERLQPRGTLKGDAHGITFSQRHSHIARANRNYCEQCHTPASCLSCHAGRFKPMRLHRSDYISHHAQDARRDQPRCVSCHRTQSFCLSCHIRSGVGQSSKESGFRPNTGVAFHPPGFNAFRAGPGHHKFSARRNINSCASCHREESCIACHGTRARRGGGFSPHPPGFASSLKCRSLLRRNSRVCLRCHLGNSPQLRCR
jgi:hypothetical protein